MPQREAEMAMEVTGASLRAAQYVRMSTDHQKYSTVNQSAANHAYAAMRGMEIVRTFADEGRSGLSLKRRDALKQLIEEVQNGRADFQAILVYDVSRWGRFQDTDESAHLEYICKRAGIGVHYCAEQFENDGSPFAAIVKSIKRAMAAEYSRELSVKCFGGQAHLVRLGFRVGSSAPYGTRRLLVDQSRASKFILAPGEYKNIQTDRVVLILGPAEEVRVVRWIFLVFVKKRKSEGEIAKLLNQKGISSGLPRPWTYGRVRKLLRNEIYIGNSVWNRTSVKLGKRTVCNPPEAWFRTKCSFDPIIPVSQFEAARKIIGERQPLTRERVLEALRKLYRKHGFLDTKLILKSNVHGPTTIRKYFGGLRQLRKLLGSKGRPGSNYGLSDDELLKKLRRLLRKRGRISELIIEKSRDVPSASTYQARFGSLTHAYKLIGYEPDQRSYQASWMRTSNSSNEQLLDALRKLLDERGYLSQKLLDKNGETATSRAYCRRFGSLARAYEIIGYKPPPGNGYIGSRRSHKVPSGRHASGPSH
jgi:DNA invertase Pin-like site-specific DNA recombinase